MRYWFYVVVVTEVDWFNTAVTASTYESAEAQILKFYPRCTIHSMERGEIA